MKLFDRYIAVATLRSFVLVAAVLTALFSLLEFVEELGTVGQGRYHVIDAAAYVLLTVPSRLLQVAPVSMLLATLLALGALARHGELTALRSLGISDGRIIGSVLKLAVLVIVVLFILAQFVIPPTMQLAQSQRSAALFPTAALRNDAGFWAQSDGRYLNVQQFDDGNVPANIDIYAFAPDGSLMSYIHADRAEIRPDGSWLLLDVVRKLVKSSAFQTDRLASLPWASFMSRQQMQALMLAPEDMPPVALYRYVRFLQRRHQQAMHYEQELWMRGGIALSVLAMAMIAAPFVFGPPRLQNPGRQMTIGAIIGVVFSLVQQITGHLGLLLDLDPAMTALAPPCLLMVLAIYLFRGANR